MNKLKPAGAVLLGASLLPLSAFASSHREAPEIAGMPRLDGTDFYMFRSYEPGRSGYVTLIANYIPLQDPGGGPNFFDLDSRGRLPDSHRQSGRRHQQHHVHISLYDDRQEIGRGRGRKGNSRSPGQYRSHQRHRLPTST